MAEKRSVATWIGIGCAAIIALGTVLIGGCVVFLYTQAQQFRDDMEDPARRSERVLEVLGTEELPEGYYPMTAFAIPLLAEIAVLTDRPPGDGQTSEGFGARGFIYSKLLRLGQDEEELRDYFEGRTDDAEVLSRNGINLDIDEIIGRGAFDLDARRVMYVAQRGDVRVQERASDGIASIIWIDCANDDRVRIGVWFGPDPDPEAELFDLDLAGTPADEAALRAFLGAFEVCG